tara:strand:- start:1048 stop:1641 length:594 start_codon:yes stop_codon:yes gene_type:complete
MATQLQPFRQYNENDVINLFTYDGTSVDAGRLLKLDSSNQWSGLGADDYVDLGSDTGNSYSNVVSTQYSLKGKLDLAGVSEKSIGINLMAMADTDENGEKLLYNPRKAAEMGVVIPGQAIPVASRGIFLYNSNESAWTGSTVNAGTLLYGQNNGILGDSSGSSAKLVGVALGGKAAVTKPSTSYHAALVKLDVDATA